MRRLKHSPHMPLVMVAVLALLLAVLATLQYRWIAKLSEAERARLEQGLDLAVAGFCSDFDREVARAFNLFAFSQPTDDADLTRLLDDRLSEWRATAVWPELVMDLTVIRNDDSGEVSVLCFDERSVNLHPCEWSSELPEIRRRFRNPGPGVPVIDGDLPGLVVSIEAGIRQTPTPGGWRPPRDHLVVSFDLEFITATILPQLAEKHFGVNGGLPYLLKVSSLDRPGKTIFHSSPLSPSRTTKPDAFNDLLGLRAFPEFSPPPGGDPGRRWRPPPGASRGPGAGRPPRNPPPPEFHNRTEEGRWILTAHHPEGSLEDVVAKARQRNMAISLAILVMLGLTLALVVASTRRARRLARQQMDFVAAVSHELRTPLTAIRSAGQNLADGIVDDPEKVRNYGLLIEREGRRLTEMIGRVLIFAGIRSGRQIYRMVPVDAAEIVQTSLDDCAWVVEEAGFVVDKEIGENLPQVNGDATALRRVITNLIDNATKYALEGGWLGVRVSFKPGPGYGEVQISISDRGPGIPNREMSSIFEPFQRGADAAGSSAPGSGLGLAVVRSIVEAHAGAIDVTSPPSGGATFLLRLPALSERSVNSEEQT